MTARPGNSPSMGETALDPPAFAAPAPVTIDALFTRHFGDVYRVVARLLGPGASSADIEDVTQQVFITAHRVLPRFRGDSHPRTWLFGIASRTVLTSLRSWGRQRRLIRALEHIPAATPPTPEKAVTDREELVRVWRALMKVKAKKRIVYVMHELEGLSGAEIAERLDIPVNTVWTRLYHARKELLAQLRRSET